MKSNKKSFIIAGLCVACVGILAVCFVLTRDKTPEFVPDPLPLDTQSEWKETGGKDNGSGAVTDNQTPGSASEEYPKQTEDADGNVEVEFTPSGEDLKPEPPEVPTADADNTNPAAPPVYTEEEIKPPVETPPTLSDTPTPGSRRADGAVYDQAFGWVMPSEVVQIPIDSEGDPNKMVGEMGP
ncbi:MAG: hypothetical protein PHY23_00935 [Oscillospiraceae bacterium]|nr:hypothetical protein [Oscillospiraceae bacterium]